MKCSKTYKDSYQYGDPHFEEKDDYKSYPDRDEYPDRDRKPDPKPKFETVTILKCGTSVGSAPISCFNTGVQLLGSGCVNHNSAVQATVSLDTSKLIDPTVKVDFSSLISFKTNDDDNYFLRLVFKLSKICDCKQIPLGTWAFERVSNEDALGGGVAPAVEVNNYIENEFVQATDSFSFSWCSCDNCPDCCQYIVEIVDQQCFNIEFAIVSNISLSALAVGLKKV